MNFSALSHWIKKARKVGLLNPGEGLPAMVEVALPADQPPPGPDPSAAVTITIGKATVTLPPSMLAQALEAAAKAMIDLRGKRVMVYPGPTDLSYGINVFLQQSNSIQNIALDNMLYLYRCSNL